VIGSQAPRHVTNFSPHAAMHVIGGDHAYDSNALRDAMTAQRAWANIRPMDHRRDPLACSIFPYRYRNLVGRFFTKLKHHRALPHATTSAPPIIRPSSSSRHSASGCAIMRRRPNHRNGSHLPNGEQCPGEAADREARR
jgi:hypothetical protein